MPFSGMLSFMIVITMDSVVTKRVLKVDSAVAVAPSLISILASLLRRRWWFIFSCGSGRGFYPDYQFFFFIWFRAPIFIPCCRSKS